MSNLLLDFICTDRDVTIGTRACIIHISSLFFEGGRGSRVPMPRGEDVGIHGIKRTNTDASRFDGKTRSAPDSKTPSETRRGSATPLSDGSDKISLVSFDWVLIRFNPKRADEDSFACSPFNLSTLRPEPRGVCVPVQHPRPVVEPERIGDRKGKGGAKYGM